MNNFSRLALGCALSLGALSASAGTAFDQNRTDFRDETIYFAMTTRFYDGDPTNNVLCWDGVENQKKYKDPAWRGDFKGLIEKLDYIKALGFTAIWITPVVQNASGFDYHGYHAMDFSEVDLRYKSRKAWGADEDVDFQDLIDAAHAKGIKIVLDIVLQHTGNFGENKLCHLFDREQNIKTQASITSCLLPDEDRLGGQDYWNLPNEGEKTQYSERFKYLKNTDGQNHDDKNYWHHVANAWNWDDPSRWWGQIAGDCVDLNTENPAVVDYLVECYGKFIEMGVDGFRIDTTGHISPLTFNSAFIPRFIELGEKYKSKRINQAPFYMFGECCARYGGVIYRDQHLLSSHYYTWKSDPALVTEWNSFTADWWANQVVREGAAPLGNMLTCLKDPGTVHNSDNVFMKNGAWHEPDYSDASGFNVIDFPMHYNFNSADQAVRIAQEGDHYYNDASWNVVYVDSHDYCPGPNDGVRFNGGTAQWAENLSLMFSFRGIPCIYYGSEVEFQKGVTIDKGPDLALHESGRAYFGAYLEGSVSASDFGTYTASGNVAKTLNADLAQHIRRLNQIRAAVPALRKGQYTFDGCSAKGGHAFKRAYKDSYALVAINGGATFTNVPAGTYVDLVTGKSYQGGGSITVDAPATQGQLRVLVKGWTGGKVGEDGKFIYDSAPVAHGGAVTFEDPGTEFFYTAEDAPAPSVLSVKFNPGSSTFKTETLSVSATLSDDATSGWYQVAGGQKVNLAKGATSTFEVGRNMNYGESVSVSWGATGEDGKTASGTVT
ncbi:MAG: alpha-amylase [Muribaculaceae bacterium]|nr:alpha-amylase [Muribaculaceae bacterium]